MSTTKQQNWQPILHATENLLADFPDMLSTLLQTWQDHAPLSPSVTAPDASPSPTTPPAPKASASAHKGSYFFFFHFS